jgi:hypothetical protein
MYVCMYVCVPRCAPERVENIYSSVSIAIGYGLDEPGSIFSNEIFPLLRNVRTGSGAHLRSYPTDSGALISEVKWLGLKLTA